MADRLPLQTRVLALSKFDRNRLALACDRRVAATPADVLLGLELRVSPLMPEGMGVALDGMGNFLGMIDFRGDHDVSRLSGGAPPPEPGNG